MNNEFTLGGKPVGPGHPTYVVAEIGINHSGNLDTALKLIDVAVEAGADACKFQKRAPTLAVPEDQWHIMRDTPWGRMSYITYRYHMELDYQDYLTIDEYCFEKGIKWFCSVWDIVSLNWLDENFNTIAYKIPSAMLTNDALLEAVRMLERPIIMSTGMSTQEEIGHAVEIITELARPRDLAVLHCTSTYPCAPEELNLRVLTAWYDHTYASHANIVKGYSNHSPGIIYPVVAVALGAQIIEAHITLDRAMWGTDQAASIEPHGFKKMVHYIRNVEAALGDGIKKVYDSELPVRKKLRGE